MDPAVSLGLESETETMLRTWRNVLLKHKTLSTSTSKLYTWTCKYTYLEYVSLLISGLEKGVHQQAPIHPFPSLSLSLSPYLPSVQDSLTLIIMAQESEIKFGIVMISIFKCYIFLKFYNQTRKKQETDQIFEKIIWLKCLIIVL